jgi:hypothetical protein
MEHQHSDINCVDLSRVRVKIYCYARCAWPRYWYIHGAWRIYWGSHCGWLQQAEGGITRILTYSRVYWGVLWCNGVSIYTPAEHRLILVYLTGYITPYTQQHFINVPPSHYTTSSPWHQFMVLDSTRLQVYYTAALFECVPYTIVYLDIKMRSALYVNKDNLTLHEQELTSWCMLHSSWQHYSDC